MVRNYRRKSYKKYSDVSLISAAKCIQREGISMRSASERFHVPFSTLRRVCQRSDIISLKTSIRKRGRQSVFSPSQEMELVCNLVHHNRNKNECLRIAYTQSKILKANVPISWKKNQSAGNDWLKSLLTRYPVAGMFIKSWGRFLRLESKCAECRQVTKKIDLKYVCLECLRAVCIDCGAKHYCSKYDSNWMAIKSVLTFSCSCLNCLLIWDLHLR